MRWGTAVLAVLAGANMTTAAVRTEVIECRSELKKTIRAEARARRNPAT